jgi:hypothetical protein
MGSPVVGRARRGRTAVGGQRLERVQVVDELAEAAEGGRGGRGDPPAQDVRRGDLPPVDAPVRGVVRLRGACGSTHSDPSCWARLEAASHALII